MEHYRMTEDQRRYLDQDLAAIMENLGNIAKLLRACYGDMDMTVIRAEEASGAVQRIAWEVERRLPKWNHGDGQGSPEPVPAPRAATGPSGA